MVNGNSFILIRQMAALVRHALAEVCTVPVPLVASVSPVMVSEVCCVVLLQDIIR